jgi:hypothetical protein
MPIFVGKAVLDLSKYVMYDFYYNKFMKTIEKNNLSCQLLFTDTDSLAFQVFTKNSQTVKTDIDLLKSIHKDHKVLDFSSWPKSHELHFKDHLELDSKLHKKRPFTFGSEFKPASSGSLKIFDKDIQESLNEFLEKNNTIYKISGFHYEKYEIIFNENIKDMKTFYKLFKCDKLEIPKHPQSITRYNPDIYIGIKAKQYIFANSLDQSYSIKSKGVPKNIVKRFIKQCDFEDIVDNNKDQIKVKYYTLQSKKNQYKTIQIEKIALSNYDDKCYYNDPYSFKYFGSCL